MRFVATNICGICNKSFESMADLADHWNHRCTGKLLTLIEEIKMETINKESFIHDMEEVKAIYQENERIINGMIVIGFDCEALVFERLSITFNKLVDVIADKYSINRDAMSWLVYENDFGEAHYECGHPKDDENYIIDSFASFWDFEKRQ